MLKKILIFPLIIAILILPIYTFAAVTPYSPVTPGLESINTGTSTIQTASGLGSKNPIDTASLIINWLLTILGLFFLVLVIYGGFIWMLARGNESEIEKATNIIKASVVGLIIILVSYGISALIFNVVANISQ